MIAAYNIGTAENPWWQTGREMANVADDVAVLYVEHLRRDPALAQARR